MRRKGDEIDVGLARAYAWRTTLIEDEKKDETGGEGPSSEAPSSDGPRTVEELLAADESPDSAPEEAAKEGAEDEDEDEGPESDGRGLAELRQNALRDATALAHAVDRAWILPPHLGRAQLDAITDLTRRAQRMGMHVTAMSHFPLQSVRFIRLVARCWDHLDEEAREAANFAAQLCDYSHPESADLVIEAVRTGDPHLNTSLTMAMRRVVEKELTRTTNVSARLARVLDEGPTDAARREALMRLLTLGRRDAAQAMRRALKRPVFGVRWRALDVLSRRFPDALEPSDALFLLEEAVIRPEPPTENDPNNQEGYIMYPDLLDRLVARHKPAGGAALLIRILEGRAAGGFRWGFLDDAWAIGVLAAAYPEAALPEIDHRFRHIEWDRRKLALRGSSRLPDEHAYSRLLLAAEDPVPEFAESARATWLTRRGSPCPAAPLAGLDEGLLDGPPSERMLARLDVFRRGPAAARAAMVRVLLDEAPDPEALVLLTFGLGDSRLWEVDRRPDLPDRLEGFVREIVSRFGARGVRAILARHARFPERRYTWLWTLSTTVTGTNPLRIPEEACSDVRAACAKRLAEEPSPKYDVLNLLSVVGAPAESVPRLCAVAWDPHAEGYLRDAASAALATLPAPELAALLDGEIDAARAASDVPRLVRAAVAGIRGGSPRATAAAEEVLRAHLDAAPDDPALVDALEGCARAMLDKGLLTEEERRSWLGRPGTCAFVIAARRAHFFFDEPDTVTALTAALSGHPVCGAAAAHALLFRGQIQPSDARLARIAERVPLPVRAGLFWSMFYHEVPPRSMWPLVEEVLVSPDPAVTGPFRHRVEQLLDGGMGDFIASLEHRVVSEGILADIEGWRDLHATKPAPYWQDEIAEDDEDEDEDEDEDAAEAEEDR
ncbi:MAG: hypothetical protein U0441_06485 [Polyangiaceae bacterium]